VNPFGQKKTVTSFFIPRTPFEGISVGFSQREKERGNRGMTEF